MHARISKQLASLVYSLRLRAANRLTTNKFCQSVLRSSTVINKKNSPYAFHSPVTFTISVCAIRVIVHQAKQKVPRAPTIDVV